MCSRHNGVHFFDISTFRKVVRTPSVFNILTSKCVSRHNSVHFFDISTSKSGPGMVCFVHFDLEMCFAPQRRALFQHLNFQKLSENGLFCTFWLRNVLRATTACTFSTSQLFEKWSEPLVFFNILTSKCVSRHNSVHFFDISTSKSGPRMVCFVHFDLEMCFAPQRRALFQHLNFQKWSENGLFCTFWLRNVLRPTTACTFSSLIWRAYFSTLRSHKSLEKHSISRLSYLFAHLSFFLLTFSLLWSFLISLLLFSSLWLFPSLLFICPYCGKFDF